MLPESPVCYAREAHGKMQRDFIEHEKVVQYVKRNDDTEEITRLYSIESCVNSKKVLAPVALQIQSQTGDKELGASDVQNEIQDIN